MSPLDFINALPIPAGARKWIIYLLIPAATLTFGVWQANDGNWKAFWPALAAAFIGAIAHAFTVQGSDTAPEETTDADDDADSDDGDATDIDPDAAVDVTDPATAQLIRAPATPVSDDEDTAAQANVVADYDPTSDEEVSA